MKKEKSSVCSNIIMFSNELTKQGKIKYFRSNYKRLNNISKTTLLLFIALSEIEKQF